jgi:hypothetical protein
MIHLKTIHDVTSHLLKINPNVILPNTPRSLKWLLYFKILSKVLYAFSINFMRDIIVMRLLFHDMITQITIGKTKLTLSLTN